MEYKYKRNQIFKKKLNVSKAIRNKVYASSLSIEEYQKYDLIDKVPVSCLDINYRTIAEIVGIEQAATLDWDFIFYDFPFAENIIRENYGKTEQHIMNVLYQRAYEEIVNCKRRYSYEEMSEGFKAVFPQLFVNDVELSSELKKNFYGGYLNLKDILDNWEIFKSKDLGNVINRISGISDVYITNERFNEFINEVGFIARNESNVFATINEYNSITDDKAKKEFLSNYVRTFVKNGIKYNKSNHIATDYTKEEYKKIFKYVSLDEYLSFYDFRRKSDVIEIVNIYGLDNILNATFPFKFLTDDGIAHFVRVFGFENIVEFDIKSGGFFSNNDWEYLKVICDMYEDYSFPGIEKNGFILKEGNVNYFERVYEVYDNKKEYNKEDFNEVIRRIIQYKGVGIGNELDYRIITGEFRELNPDLFVNEMLPEEFKTAFYTNSLTPEMIYQNSDYIQFLRGKNLASCFKKLNVSVRCSEDCNSASLNFYQFLLSKTDYDRTMELISNYSSVLEVLCSNYDRLAKTEVVHILELSDTDDMETIKKKMNEKILELLLKTNIKYSASLSAVMGEKYPSIFMNNNAPKELQEKFYNREINSSFIAKHPEYKEFLKGMDMEVLFKPIYVLVDEIYPRDDNLIKIIKEVCGNETGLDVLLAYGKYLDIIDFKKNFEVNMFSYKMTTEEVISKIESEIYSCITKEHIIYDDKMPQRFKNKYQFLFLPPDTPNEILNKFYNRKFTIEDFTDSELLNYFTQTDIVCALNPCYSCFIGLFKKFFGDNDKTLKIINEFIKINDVSLQNVFSDYIVNNIDSIQMEKINQLSEVLFRLLYSNSSEISTFSSELAKQLLLTNNPLDNLNKIEDVFLRNNIPQVGKIFSVFQILHPNTSDFCFTENSKISPVLRSKSENGKQITIFADLLKASFGSNNRSIKEYLDNMKIGNQLLSQVVAGSTSYEQLDNQNKMILSTFISHLNTLYNNTMVGKAEATPSVLSNDIKENINELVRLFSTNGNFDYNLTDRIIKMFCHFAGFDTFEQANEYFTQKPKMADDKNRAASRMSFRLEQGDFVKGIGEIKYLNNILQNGSLAKEFLGSSSDSDLTPLDTDLSRIICPSENIMDALNKTESKCYGPIWLVLKYDDRFAITRKSPYEADQTIDIQPNPNKLEAFYTGAIGVSHYGIRTGFASSEIDYILVENYDNRIGLELSMNGFYIPIVDKTGKLVFSTEEYDKLRDKMAGLTHFETNQYNIANSLLSSEAESLLNLIPESIADISRKHNAINNVLAGAVANLGLKLKTKIDGDLTEGSVELIDTGSTGRGTNMPGDGDFDFMMRLDKKIIANPEKLKQVKETLLKSLGRENSSGITGEGDFRMKDVLIEGLDTPVDIDITFVKKTDKIVYSTEMALHDRLETIRKQYPEQYHLVVANILLAKKTLKKAGVYKPNRGEVPQGGLGGVGIENWVLQNGGSFEKASREFLEASKNKTFEEFKSSYAVWDFGENHLAINNGYYPHDNFIARNMSQDGYLKMKQVLTNYCMDLGYQQTESMQR